MSTQPDCDQFPELCSNPLHGCRPETPKPEEWRPRASSRGRHSVQSLDAPDARVGLNTSATGTGYAKPQRLGAPL